MKVAQESTKTLSLAEVLQHAYDTEMNAYHTYSKVVGAFGDVFPFSNVLQAEQNHQAALMQVASIHNIELQSQEYGEPFVPKTVLECCEIGVACELKTIRVYDELLGFVKDYPEVQDLFYRLQAASYNNHLTAFRQCVAAYAKQDSAPAVNQNPMAALEGMMGQWEEFAGIAQKVARGEMSQAEMTQLLSSNFSFIAGALLGVVGTSVLGGVLQKDDEEKNEDESLND